MKKNTLKYLLPAIMVLMLYSCGKQSGVTNQAYSVYGVAANQGQLKINLGFAYTKNYSMLIKINDQVVSNLLTTRTPFPGGGFNTNGSSFALYIGVNKGDNKVSLVIPNFGTNTDSVVLYTTTVTIPDNNAYTLHIADTMVNSSLNNTKSLLVKNEIADVDVNFCRFRFVNMIPNLTGVDLYLNGVKMKSNIPFMAATDTFTVRTDMFAPGFNPSATTAWAVRPVGASPTSAATATYTSTNGLQSQRVMTIFSMGYAGFTGTKLPFVALTLDKNQ